MVWKITDIEAQSLPQANKRFTSLASMTAEIAKNSTPAQTLREYPDHWWDADLWADLRNAGPYADVLAAMRLDDLPSAKETEAELARLLEMQASGEREKRRPEILEEAERPPPAYTMTLFLDDGRRRLTRALMIASVVWSRKFILSFKHKYRRPRPTQLEPRLKPMLLCPGHPAYPSGHSTQAHLLALLFGKLSGRPDIAKAMFDAADRIAENREYAGLHYPSDSAAGVALARQLMVLFEGEFADAIAAARTAEWS